MTRDPERIDRVLEELEEYWKEHPDLRLGQIVSNAANDTMGTEDPFYLEDIDMQAFLERRNESDFEESQKKLIEDLVGMYENILGDLKEAVDYEEESGFKFGEDREEESGFFEEWEKYMGDCGEGLSCPECDNDEYEADGWCIKCPECGFRSRSERPWK